MKGREIQRREEGGREREREGDRERGDTKERDTKERGRRERGGRERERGRERELDSVCVCVCGKGCSTQVAVHKFAVQRWCLLTAHSMVGAVTNHILWASTICYTSHTAHTICYISHTAHTICYTSHTAHMSALAQYTVALNFTKGSEPPTYEEVDSYSSDLKVLKTRERSQPSSAKKCFARQYTHFKSSN